MNSSRLPTTAGTACMSLAKGRGGGDDIKKGGPLPLFPAESDQYIRRVVCIVIDRASPLLLSQRILLHNTCMNVTYRTWRGSIWKQWRYIHSFYGQKASFLTRLYKNKILTPLNRQVNPLEMLNLCKWKQQNSVLHRCGKTKKNEEMGHQLWRGMLIF
jgi:hypothetical protein